MPPPVRTGQWIKIGPPDIPRKIDGYVIKVYSEGTLSVGYYQDELKAVKEDVIWTGEYWNLSTTGCNGIYLHGADEAIVKRGPTH